MNTTSQVEVAGSNPVCTAKNKKVMKPKYVIQSLVDLGYWSLVHRAFKGIVFASRFDSVEQAENFIEWHMPKFTPTETLTIIPIYQK